MSTQIELPVLVTMVESFQPCGVRFNEHGVATYGYRWTVWNDGGYLEFDVICRNGSWGGSSDVASSSWGYGGPIDSSSFKYPTLEACITDMWNRFADTVKRYEEQKSSSINYKTKWFNRAKMKYEKFLSLSQEEQLKLFKEVDFYG